jgi:DNA-binding transcriptional regulator YdaS (Cro superfamily)
MSSKKAIERAIALAGSEAKLGRGIGFSQVAVNKARRSGRASPRMALAIHRFLGGAVSAADIAPGMWATHEDAARAAALQEAGAAA